MANVLKIKRGSSVPSSSDLAVYELGYRTGTTELYINDNGTYRQLGGSSSGAVDSIANFSDNRLLTASDADSINGEANLTFDGTDLSVAAGGKISVDEVEGKSNNTNTLLLNDDQTAATNMVTLQSINHINIMTDGNNNGTGNFAVYNGSYDVDTADLAFRITSTGLARFENDIDIPATDRIYLDGRGNTYITESSGDTMKLVAGGQDMLILSEASDDMVYVPDNVYLAAGTSQDLTIMHNGTDSTIAEATGHLYIKTTTSNKDISFTVNDGGTTRTALKIDASETAKVMLPQDGQTLSLGAGNDLTFQHDGSNSYIGNGVGHLYISNDTDDGDIIFRTDNGSGGVTNYLQIDGGSEYVYFHKDIALKATEKLYLDGGGNTYITESSADRVKIFVGGSELVNIIEDTTNVFRLSDSVKGTFGNADDFRLYHDATNSSIENHTGNLYIDNNTDDGEIIFRCDDGSGGVTQYLALNGTNTRIDVNKTVKLQDDVEFQLGNGADLYFVHNNTDSYMINGTGDLVIRNNADDKDILLQTDNNYGNTTNYIQLDGSAKDIKIATHMQFADDKELRIGNDNDLRLVSNNSNTFIDNYLGSMYIRQTVDDSNVYFQCDNGSGALTNYFYLDGSNIRTIFSEQVRIADSKQLGIGDGDDLEIKHDGSHTIMQLNNGNLYFKDQSGNNIIHIMREGDGVQMSEGDFTIPATSKIRLDGSTSGNTYIYEESGDNVMFYIGGRNMLRLHEGNGEVVVNDSQVDTNFRVESDTIDDLLFCDAGTSRVGIGTNAPAELFEVAGTAKISSTGNTTLYIDGAGNGYTSGQIVFQGSDDDASYRGTGVFNHDAASDIEYFSGTLYANDAWAVCRKTSVSSHDSSVAQGSNSLFIIEGGGDVGIGTSNPTQKLEVAGTIKATGTGGFTIGNVADVARIQEGSNEFSFLTTGNAYANIYTADITAHGKLIHYGDTNTYFNFPGADEAEIVTNSVQRVQFSNSEVVFNESGASIDFRVEGDTDNLLFFVDGSADKIGIGTNVPEGKVHIYGGNASVAPDGDGDDLVVESNGDAGISILSGESDGNTGSLIFGSENDGNGAGVVWDYYNKLLNIKTQNSNGILRFASANNSEAMRINTSGNVIVGATTNVATIGQTAAFQVLGTGNGDSHLNIGRFSNNTSAPMLTFTKSRSGTIGTSTVVQDGDACGTIGWAVADGTDFESYIAAIGTHVDGSPSGNDTPGRIEFNTTADGSAGSIEAMRLDSSQDAHFDQDVIAFSTTPSDIRLKKNFTKIENGLDIVLQLEGHTFNWKKERSGERLSAGFKAQEVEKILPHLVDEKKLPLRADDDKEYKILRYEEMIPYLVEAIKELKQEIQELKNG